MSHKTRKFAGLVASIAVGISLLGAGTYATFNDTASATDSISVANQGVKIESSTPNAVVVNSGSTHTVTLPLQTLTSSTAGQSALDFQVDNIGGTTFTATVVSSDGFAAPWSDLFINPGVQTIAPGGHYDYSGGIKWATLSNTDEGTTHSVTYTITITG